MNCEKMARKIKEILCLEMVVAVFIILSSSGIVLKPLMTSLSWDFRTIWSKLHRSTLLCKRGCEGSFMNVLVQDGNYVNVTHQALNI